MGTGLQTFSCSSSQKLLYDAGSNATYYWYIAAHRFTVRLKTDYNFLGTPIFKAKLQYWNGSSWVDYGSQQTIDNAWCSWTSAGNENWKWRLAYWHTKNSYAEYLYGDLRIDGIGESPQYDSAIIGKYIGRVTDGAQHQYKVKTSPNPQDVACMQTSSYRGSLITASVPARCFVVV